LRLGQGGLSLPRRAQIQRYNGQVLEPVFFDPVDHNDCPIVGLPGWQGEDIIISHDLAILPA
jgi:hypothetical protein